MARLRNRAKAPALVDNVVENENKMAMQTFIFGFIKETAKQDHLYTLKLLSFI